MAHDNLVGAAVTVGFDGSEASLGSVVIAAREAVMRARPLEILHAVDWPTDDVPVGELDDKLRRDQYEAAERLVADAIAAIRPIAGDIEIRNTIVVSSPAAALLRAAEHAAVIVVGVHGDSGVIGIVAGSTTVQVATHATCPVLICRGQPTTGGEIVLGVDGSPKSASAVAFAFEEAALSGTSLHAVHAWRHPIAPGPGDSLPLLYMDSDVEAEEGRLLAEATSGWSDKYPDVTVRRSLVRGRAVHVLADASAGASMLVVGARGHGGFEELLLGSVGLTLMHKTTCPIAIVRPGAHAA